MTDANHTDVTVVPARQGGRVAENTGRLIPPVSDDDRVVLDMVGIGWTVWERQDDPDIETIRGGTVVEVKELALEQTRAFVILDFFHGQPRLDELLEHEINPSLCQLPNASFLRSAARRLQALAGRKKGSVDAFELRLSKIALLLLEVIA